MTDNTAPERIWAFAPDIFDNMSVWQDQPSPAGDAVEYIRADLVPDTDALTAYIAELEAERDRLREALEYIENIQPMFEGGMGVSKTNLQNTLEEARQIARAALNEGGA